MNYVYNRVLNNEYYHVLHCADMSKVNYFVQFYLQFLSISIYDDIGIIITVYIVVCVFVGKFQENNGITKIMITMNI